jgi:deazaflavin-dependent oxidoreductase (nitroreductase family)
MAENSFADMNKRIIAEFRANAGVVGGGFAGAPMILLTITGAKSGKQYVSPLVYLADGDDWVVIASKGGAPTNPDWYYNLKANPNLTIEVGSDTIAAVATEVTGAERDALYARQAAVMSNFDEYQKATTRVIPVFRLTRA